MDTHNECAICLSECDHSSTHLEPCNHVFHIKCITQWLDKSGTCPLCRVRATLPPQTKNKPRQKTLKIRVLEAIELHMFGLTLHTKTTKYRYALLYRKLAQNEMFHDMIIDNDIQKITPEIVNMALTAYQILHPSFKLV